MRALSPPGRIVPQSLEAYREVAACLEAGGLAIIPGVTNYSLVVNAANDRAVQRFYALKLRPSNRPITLLVPPHDADRHIVVPERNRPAFMLLGQPIVIIGRPAPGLGITPRINAGSSGLGIYWLDTPMHQVLYNSARCPIAGSSLNLSGQPMITRFEDAHRHFADHVDLVVQGPDCPAAGHQATVLDVAHEPATLLRPGIVSAADIRALLPELRTPTEGQHRDAPASERLATGVR
jgi:L-threonylcarbamoyladenylate synthase